MEQDSDWERRLTRVIAGEIRRHRQQIGLSAQKLSDRTEVCGLRVPRAVITNLENGHRESISVAEWQVLGEALGVAPLRLLLPLGHRQFVDLPGGRLNTWDAYLRTAGMVGDPVLPTSGTSDIELYQIHGKLTASALPAKPPMTDSPDWPTRAAVWDLLVAQARQVRTFMRDRGLVPPPLSGGWAAALGEPGAIAAAVVTSSLGLLVGRRNDGTPPWTLIAGEIEPGEQPEDAAERECKEETGLEVTVGDVIGERLHPATGRWMIYLAAEPVSGTDVFVGDATELAEVRWVTLAEADELLGGMFKPVREHLARTLRAGAS